MPVWENSFDGPAQQAITSENSAEYGDPITFGSGSIGYSTTQSVRGTSSLWGGSSTAPGVIGAGPLDIPEDGPFALRFYFRAPSRGNLVVSTEPSGTDGERFLLVYAGMTDPRTVIGRFSGSRMVNSWFTNWWIRFEMVRDESGHCTARLWRASNMDASAEGSHNLEVEWDDPGTAFNTLYFRVRDNAYHPDVTLDWGTYVDELKIVPGTSEWVGPATLPAPEILWENTFDGPDGTTVTEDNSGNYGNALGHVSTNVVYDHSWSILGDASLRTVVEDSHGSVETTEIEATDWSVRVYAYIPADSDESEAVIRTWAHSNNSYSTLLHVNHFAGTVNVLDQTIETGSGPPLGTPFRLEASKIGLGCTVRLWWTSLHSTATPDYEASVSDSTWGAMDALGLTGSYASAGVFFDEAVVGDGAWVGPAVVNEIITEVTYTAQARGVVGGSANAIADIEYVPQAQGWRSDAGVGLQTVQFAAEASGEGFIPTLAAADIEYTTEATGGAYYTGGGTYALDVGVETSATKTTTGDALEGEVVYEPTAEGRARTHLPDVPLVGMQYRLIAYDPDGERRGQLPWPLSFQLGVPLNDTPSLALEYLKDAPGAGLLDSLCEVAVEFSPAGSPTFVEPPGCRFLSLRQQEDPADRTGVVRYTMPSYVWMLRKVRNLNTNALNEEGQREFSEATPGRIIHTFLIEAQERGNVPGMVWDFTTTHDSAGRPWETAYNITFDAGQDLWSIIEALSGQHALDWRVHRRTLQMYNPDTGMNRDRSEQAILRMHRDVSEAPNDRSGEELATRVFVQGDNAHVQLTNNTGMQPWGAWEDYISQNGVSDTGTLTALAQWRMETTRGMRTQMTRGILFNTARHLPFFAYQVGDYISAPGWFSQMDPLRVRQITISSTDPYSLEGNLVLNDRFIERQLRNDRRLNALTGGSPPGGGGGGGRPPGEDTRTPQAPQNLLLHSDAYINEYGEPRAQITANWSAVTHATNNTEMDIRRYEVWTRRVAFGSPFQFQTEVDTPQVSAHMSWFEPGEVYEVRVRAFGRNDRPGLWSDVEAVRAERDTDPPNAPSGPSVSSRLGVLRVAWDGLDFDGLNMPSDFDHLQVWMGATPSSEFEHVDTLYRAGVSVIPNQPYGQERFFFFVAVDRAGNESDPSALGSGTTERLVPIDVTPGSIGYELLEEGAVRDEVLAEEGVMNRHIAAGQITGEKVRAYSIFADRLAIGTSRNLITDPHHMDEDLNQTRLDVSTGPWGYFYDAEEGRYQLVLPVNASQATYTYYYVQSPDVEHYQDRAAGIPIASEVGRIVSRARLRVEGLESGQLAVVLTARSYTHEGVQLGWTYTTPQLMLTEAGEYELVSDNGAAIHEDADHAVMSVYVTVDNPSPGTRLFVTQFFTALSNGQVLIENGAVSANKIAANAVTADKIEAGAVEAVHIQADAIDTDRLSARAITAKHTIVGANIRTTAEANRGVVMNVNGIIAHDSIGNQTFTVSSSTGDVSIIGRFRTGRQGQNRVEVSDSANYFNQPGVRLYSGGAGARDSSLFIADAQGTGGWDPYTVALTGAEQNRNSSGRTDLVLRPFGSGGGALRYQWSAWGMVGISFTDYQLTLTGRNPAGQRSNTFLTWGQSTTLSPRAGAAQPVTFTYGAPSAQPGRLVMASGQANYNYARMMVTVTQQSSASCRITGVREDGGSFRLQYYAMWVQGSV